MNGRFRWFTTWGAVLGYCGLIFFISGQPFGVPWTVPSADIGIHVVLYAGLGWLWTRAVQYSWPTTRAGLNLVSALVFTALYGLSDEWHQLYVPGRMADIRDVIADILGGTVGSFGFLVWRRVRAGRIGETAG